MKAKGTQREREKKNVLEIKQKRKQICQVYDRVITRGRKEIGLPEEGRR